MFFNVFSNYNIRKLGKNIKYIKNIKCIFVVCFIFLVF